MNLTILLHIDHKQPSSKPDITQYWDKFIELEIASIVYIRLYVDYNRQILQVGMNINIEKDIKIVLLGDSGVGKSSIVLRFIANEFRPFFETTLGAAFTQKKYEYRPNIFYKFCMWDTAGQEKYHSLTHMYYRDA